MKRLSENEIKSIAREIAEEVKKRIDGMNLAGIEFRRDFDGVSQDAYLLQKLIGEALADQCVGGELQRGMGTSGLIVCTDDETMTEAEMREDALAAGIPLSVIEGKTKLTDHFSKEYINFRRGKK